MERFITWVRRFVRELRRRRVIRVAVVYATTGFVILELADILQPALRLPSWTVRFIAVLLGLGLPLAIGLAWVYNITDEGVVREVGEESLASATETSPLTSNGLIVGLLALVAGILLYPQVFSSGGPTFGPPFSVEEAVVPDTTRVDSAAAEEEEQEPPDRSIAVLPFTNLSSAEGTQPIARGLHDDLLTRLSNVSGLTVISRTSVERYRDTDLSLPAIADSLGAKWIVEGGVQQAGGRIQVNAQLIDPRSDAHRWADRYQRDLSAENLFGIQGEIAQEIAGALEAQLTAGEQSRVTGAPTDNLRAYRLYVRGRSQLDTRSVEGMRRAVGYFQEALEEDSTFALAWAGLADAAGLISSNDPDSLEVPSPGQEKAARRALELDPNLAEAHASLGYFHLRQENGPAALRHLKRAVELKPSYAQARHWLGFLQLGLGRPEEGLQQVARAVELNPQHQAANGVLTWAYIANRQLEEALTQARKVRRMDPSTRNSLEEIMILRNLGRTGEATKLAEKALSEADSTELDLFRTELAFIEVKGGDTSRAERLLASDRKRQIPSFGRGLLHATLGHTDAAIEAFRDIEEWALAGMTAFRYWFPELLGPLRKEPRYEEIIQEINQQWGLNPDGTVPEETDSPTGP